MIKALRLLFGRARPGGGIALCADPEAANGGCIDGEAIPPSADTGATSVVPTDEEIELMRYLLLPIAAAY
ncbi:hypothetical protein [Paraburkholderia sp. JPY419]|uniref:hypothetical protein n=1 Tax=Paraburkholderia sp. JPY419 TaxID=667660 RepID=UPI003D1BB081